MASNSSLEREFLIAGALFAAVCVGVLVALLVVVEGPADPSTVEAARLSVIEVDPEPPPPPPPRAAAPHPVRQPPLAKPAPELASEPPPSEPVAAEEGAFLRGSIRSDSGTPVEGARIQILRGRRRLADGLSDGSGSFSVGPIPAGHIRVVANHDEYAEVSSRYPRVPEEPIELVVKSGALLEGRVVIAQTGEPIRRASVRVAMGTGENDRAMRRVLDRGTRTDEEGRFSFQGLPPGKVSLAASAGGYAVSEARLVDIEGGTRITDIVFELQRESVVQGRIVDDQSGNPIARALVVFRPPYPAGARRARSTSDGKFRLKGVSPGTVSIEVSRTGYMTRWVSGLSLSGGETLADVEVRLQRPGGSLQAPAGGGPGVHRTPKVQYAGIGARLAPAEGGVRIQSVFQGSPAQVAGLNSGDVILEVDGRPVGSMDLRRVVERIKGQEGDLVSLLVRRADGSTSFVQPVRQLLSF